MTPEQSQLITDALAGKVRATGQYDAILWKIRAGYAAILYGSLGLFLGTSGVPNVAALAADPPLCAAIFLIIVGFSFSIFLIDYAYVRQKLKVVVTRDALIHWLASATKEVEFSALVELLKISGEDPRFDVFLDHSPGTRTVDAALAEAYKLAPAYRARLQWNRSRVLVPLYLTAPLISVIAWIAVRALA